MENFDNDHADQVDDDGFNDDYDDDDDDNDAVNDDDNYDYDDGGGGGGSDASVYDYDYGDCRDQSRQFFSFESRRLLTNAKI